LYWERDAERTGCTGRKTGEMTGYTGIETKRGLVIGYWDRDVVTAGYSGTETERGLVIVG